MLFFVTKKEGIDSIENKEKLTFPTFDTSGISGYMTHYENYFNNHFPYKYSYIQTLNYLQKDILKSFNAKDKVIIGKNNWLFYNATLYDSLGLNEYCGYYQWNKSQLEKVKSNIEAIEAFCKKNNIQFQLLICPSKHSIYNEYLPDFYQKQNDNRYDQLQQILPNALHVKELLLEYKKISPNLLYYKTDTHWNLLSGAIVGKALSKRLSLNFKEIPTLDNFSIKDSLINHGYDLANMLALKNCYKDTFYQISFNEITKTKIPHLMIVHDSFIEAIYPSLNQLFSKITPRQLYIDGIPTPEVLLKEKPDVLIIELVERYKEVLSGNIHPDFFK